MNVVYTMRYGYVIFIYANCTRRIKIPFTISGALAMPRWASVSSLNSSSSSRSGRDVAQAYDMCGLDVRINRFDFQGSTSGTLPHTTHNESIICPILLHEMLAGMGSILGFDSSVLLIFH